MAALRHEVIGAVRLGVIGSIGRWLMPDLLATMRDRHPRVELVVVDATTTSLLPQLLDGSLDLAVVNLPVSDPEIGAEPLFAEERILVVPGGHDLAFDARDETSVADEVYVTSDNPRTEDPQRIIDEVCAGFRGPANAALDAPRGWTSLLDRHEALVRTVAAARSGDVVLVAGKGHETYQDVGGVRRAFDDAAVVCEALVGEVQG